MSDGKLLPAVTMIVSIFVTIIVSCIGFLFALILIKQYGAPQLTVLVDTTGAIPTSIFIGSAIIIYYWVRSSVQKSTFYRTGKYKQQGVSAVIYDILEILIDRFLFCLFLGLWQSLAAIAFEAWILSGVLFFGGIWLINRKMKAEHS